MHPGIGRSDVPHAWPPTLTRPSGDVRVIYLDLNHWISLAKASVRHRDGDRHREALAVLRGSAASGRAVFPLSSAHYMEMTGISDPRQRSHLAGVMEELSGFSSFVSRSIVIQLELEAALDALSVKRRVEPLASVPILGHGVLQAFGKRGGLRIGSDDGDVTDLARQEWPGGPLAFDQWRSDAELAMERAMLRGPEDDEIPRLKTLGWDGSVARRTAEARARAERDQAARFAAEPRWRRGRTRDVVSARYMLIELREVASEALRARGLALEDVWHSPEAARQMIDCMPSADVAVTLLTAGHRNPQTKWTSNDIFDLDALSVAVPYADVVVTERHAHHTLHAQEAPSRCGTTLLCTLDELAQVL